MLRENTHFSYLLQCHKLPTSMAPSSSERREWDNAGKNVVILHQFRRAKTCPNPSPFCLKLETFLRFSGTDYKTENKHFRSEKGKSPWITMNGKDIADSEIAMEHIIKKTGKNLDEHLTPQVCPKGASTVV